MGQFDVVALIEFVLRQIAGAPHDLTAVGHRELRFFLPRLHDFLIGKEFQVRIKNVEHELSFGCQVMMYVLQARQLILDGKQVLKRPERRRHQAEFPPEIEITHIALDELHHRVHVLGFFGQFFPAEC